MNELLAVPDWHESDALSLPGRAAGGEDEMALVRRSGLFDAAWYAAQLEAPPADAEAQLRHFMEQGWRALRHPNAYFDTGFYLSHNPDVARSAKNPLVHYLRHGEAQGRAPAEYFDVLWYRARHDIAPHETALRHFLERRLDGVASPIAEFDPAHYLRASPDVAAAGVDPFEHYLLYGYREGRDPSAAFDTRYYMRRYMGDVVDLNPLLHYRRFRHVLGLHTRRPAHEVSVLDEVRRFTRAGPEFETRAALPRSAARRAKVLAYYLPQFHAIAENDAWWGEGFTEWNSVARGMPRFAGHYQPRIPRDLGHYTLDGTETLRRQIAFAREAGLFGFVQYFYWFNAKRLLERPLEAFLADATLDFPFCLMWTNENWTRRWDGGDQEVLISQDYRAADDAALVDTLARHFADPRYIRLQGRPVLMVYRPALIPDTRATVARWRALFAARHGEAPLLVMAQSFDATDPRDYGCDAAIEFPPHKLVGGLPLDDADLAFMDGPGMDGPGRMQVFSYAAVAAASLAEQAPDFPLIKTAVPGWDNDARRQGTGLMLRGATPRGYEDWLSALVERAGAHPVFGERLVCVNAWNEWAEGAYLEPDMHYGSAFLNATARAVSGLGARLAPKLLLVGHDAFPAGAQHLLLQLGRRWRAGSGLEIEFLLLGDGALRGEYASLAPTHVVSAATLGPRLAALAARGFRAAIVNTAAAASAVPALHAAGLASVLLVHEMPGLLEERGLLPDLARALPLCARAVFAAEAVRDAVSKLVRLDAAICAILPQGVYRPAPFDADARRRMRLQLGVAADAKLVLGIGYGDLRKGFDLFLQVWRARGDASVFCWVGALDPAMRAYLGAEIAAATASGAFHVLGYRDDVADWLSAGDVLLLPSREDAFPSVVLEAMSAGLRTVTFAGSGGIVEALERHGCGVAVEMGDVAAMARALARETVGDRASIAAAAFDFGDYAASVARLALPEVTTISAAVVSYNHARFIERRLASVFAQEFPVREVLLLDDCSTDDSVAIAQATAQGWRRELVVLGSARNSGRATGQWRRAAEAARAEFIWLAEGDDDAEPAMLARLGAMLAASPDIDLAFCDSRAIDAAGDTVFADHQAYYAGALTRTALFPARDFARRFLAVRNLLVNASAVLWRRTALLAALDRCGDELAQWRLAADWRLYVEVMAESDGCVAYVAEPLNAHRRHSGGVTAGMTARRHAAEIARMHRVLGERFGLDAAERKRQAAYVAEVRRGPRATGMRGSGPRRAGIDGFDAVQQP